MSKKGPRARCKDGGYNNSWFSILMDSVSTLDKDGFHDSGYGNKLPTAWSKVILSVCISIKRCKRG